MERLAINGGKPVRNPNEPFRGGTFIGEEEKRAVLDVLESQELFRYHGDRQLSKVAQFEEDFARVLGTRYALAVCSGTAALHTGLAALGITCGDEVLVPAFYYVATAHAVLATGALPVFVEVDDTLTMDINDMEQKITDRTKAVIPVHMRGVTSDLDGIMKVARKHNLSVLEDCAQSAGATFRGRYIGTFGDAGAFSLQYYKVLTTGDGGVLTLNDLTLYEKAVRFHNNGNFPGGNPKDAVIGLNLRMTELSGAIAGEQLKKLDAIVSLTRQKKNALKSRLRQVADLYPRLQFRRLHDPEGEVGISIVLFVPEDKGQAFSTALLAEGIPNWWLYNSAGHSYHTSYQILNKRTLNDRQYPFSAPWNRQIDYYEGMCPQTDSFLRRSVHIEITPFLSELDLDQIAEAVAKVCWWLLR